MAPKTRKKDGVKIDWQEYLSQYDIIYQMPARIWQDGIVLGNGSLGALACEPFHPEWVINKNDVWDYRHPEFKRHTMAEMREMIAQGKDYVKEMNKENISGFGLYPCPKSCGQLRIRFGLDSIYSPGHRITKRLNLYEGTLHTQLDKHLSHPRITSFICAEENLLVIQVREVSAMVAFHNHVDLFRTPDALIPGCIRGAQGDTIWLEQPFPDGFRYVMAARVAPMGGSAYADMFRATVQKKWWNVIEPSTTIESRLDGEYAVAPVAGDFDIYLTVITSLESKDPLATAKEQLAASVGKGSAKLHQAHRRWWAGFWPKNYVGLEEPLLEQLWYVSLYHLASVLRGTPVAGLCGLWFGPMDTPSQILPWMGSYTNDYNAQLPVMPVFRTNHPELADGTFRTLLGQLPGAKENARKLYCLPGAYYPMATDPTGDEITNGPYRFCQGSGPYWGVFLWRHYLYTGDKEYLKQVTYPIMREVAEFFAHYLVWHEEEGLYHLEISQNAELMHVKYPDPIDTLALLKYTLKATVEAAWILGCDQDLADKCRHVLEHYPAYARHGLELSPLNGLPPNHMNHLRTLAGLFPCGEFDPEINPEWYDICRFEINKMDFWSRNYGCNKGWTYGWTGVIYHAGIPACLLGLKEKTWEYLEDLLNSNVKPNGLISHNAAILANSALSEQNIKKIPDAELRHDLDPEPLKAVEVLNGRLSESVTDNLECRDTIFPALEGPAVYLLLLGEMLLQSHNGILRFFPGLPDRKDATFVDLRAEGPTLVSARRTDGEVLFVHLKACADVNWKIKNPWSGKKVWLRSLRSGKEELLKPGKYLELNLRQGEEITLAVKRPKLAGLSLVKPRIGEEAQPQTMPLKNGGVVWIGKPQPSRYYASLEKACGGTSRVPLNKKCV